MTDVGLPGASVARGRWPIVFVVALLAAAYAALHLSVTVVTEFGGASGTTFWPAAGLTVAVLLRRDVRDWAWLLAGVWIAELTCNLVLSDVSVAVSVGWATANCAEPALSAFLLTRNRRDRPNLSRSGDLVRFLALAVIVGPAAGALIGVGSGVADGFYGFWPAFPRWFVGDAVGAVALAPMLLLRRRDLWKHAGILRTLVLVGVLGSGTVLATAPWGVSWGAALPFLVVPVLVATALVCGETGAAFGVAIVATAVNAMTAAGYGPFALDEGVTGLIVAQSFVFMCAVTALVVAAITDDLVTTVESDRAKTALVQTVAHDLRGPLGVISGFASLLRDPVPMPDEQREHMLRSIEATAMRLAKVAGEILDLDRVSTAVRQTVDVSAIAHRLAAELENETHEITVEAEPLSAYVDPADVERILENLVANAVRHTRPGTPILVRLSRVPNGVLLSVDDRGPGIEDELKKAIFAPYRKAQSSSPGMGIGLAMIARLAKRHDGNAWVEDRIGGGSSFRVFFRDAPP